MRGIYGYGQQPSHCEQSQARIESRQGRRRTCDDTVVPTGQPPEVEQDDRGGIGKVGRADFLQHGVVRTFDMTPVLQASLLQPLPRTVNRGLLDVEGQYGPTGPHGLRQEHRIVSVARCCINCPRSGYDVSAGHDMYGFSDSHACANDSSYLSGPFRPHVIPMLLQRLDEPIAVELPENRSYEIVFSSLDTLPDVMRSTGLRPGKVLVVTDSNVAALYRDRLDRLFLEDGWDPLVLVLPAGETTKSPKHLHAVYDAALAFKVDRRTPVVAFGGGVIGDLAGYAAATLLRGLPYVQVPTSLIAQVDSAIGGKTGINHPEGKNLIGAFHQPRLVLTDSTLLFTLDRRQWTSGLAEVLKHAIIADEPFFAWIESEWSRILARDPGVVPDMVYRAARVKAGIVSKDELEQGRRAILNYGHTFAHALEQVCGYGTLTHGEAVVVGMRAALFLSRRLHRHVDQARIDAVLRAVPVPPLPEDLKTSRLHQAMDSDKKRESGQHRFILLRKVGVAYVEEDVTSPDVEAAWAFALGHPC